MRTALYLLFIACNAVIAVVNLRNYQRWHKRMFLALACLAAVLIAVSIALLTATRASASPVGPWHTTTASTYGYCGVPGEPCGGMACDGLRVEPGTWGVAHKTLPCGTVIQVCVGHRCRRVRVRDRGPFVAGRDIDLTYRVGRALRIDGIATARWRVLHR